MGTHNSDQPEAFTDYKPPITSHSSESPPALPKLRMWKAHQGQAERPSPIHALGWLNISLLGDAPIPTDNENITENVIAKTHPLTQSVAQLLREGFSSNEHLFGAFFDQALPTDPFGDDLMIKMIYDLKLDDRGMIYDLKLEITGGVLKGELQLTEPNSLESLGVMVPSEFKGTILVKPKESTLNLATRVRVSPRPVPLHLSTIPLGTVNIDEGFKLDALQPGCSLSALFGEECPVCFELKELEQNPECGHSFCKACIHSIRKMRRRKKKVKCPICRELLPAGYCNLIWSVGDVPDPRDSDSESSDIDSDHSSNGYYTTSDYMSDSDCD